MVGRFLYLYSPRLAVFPISSLYAKLSTSYRALLVATYLTDGPAGGINLLISLWANKRNPWMSNKILHEQVFFRASVGWLTDKNMARREGQNGTRRVPATKTKPAERECTDNTLKAATAGAERSVHAAAWKMLLDDELNWLDFRTKVDGDGGSNCKT